MFQQTTIIGNVGGKPELRYLQNGIAVCSFSVAVNETYKSGDEKQTKTTWFKVTAWRGLAETIAQYVHTGDKIFIVGRVSVSAYVDKAGNAAASLELTANEVKFLGSKRDSGGDDGYDNRYSSEDIPF